MLRCLRLFAIYSLVVTAGNGFAFGIRERSVSRTKLENVGKDLHLAEDTEGYDSELESLICSPHVPVPLGDPRLPAVVPNLDAWAEAVVRMAVGAGAPVVNGEGRALTPFPKFNSFDIGKK